MPLITFAESTTLWGRWVDATNDDKDASYHRLKRFLGMHALITYVTTDDGYVVAELEAHRAQMLLGPHYKAIIKAWLIREGIK